MATLLTALFLLALASAAGLKVLLANRRAAREAAARAAARRDREVKERELRDLVEKVKRKDALAAVASAVDSDPERAARTLGKMMRQKD